MMVKGMFGRKERYVLSEGGGDNEAENATSEGSWETDLIIA
jgi:hypothetical protein